MEAEGRPHFLEADFFATPIRHREYANCDLNRAGQSAGITYQMAIYQHLSVPTSLQTISDKLTIRPDLHWLGPTLMRSLGFVVAGQNYYDFSTSVSLFQISDSLRNFTQLVNLVDNRFYLAGRHQLAHHGQILSV